jgi:hypothetical protein
VSSAQLVGWRNPCSIARETPREHAAAAEPSRDPQVWTCSL